MTNDQLSVDPTLLSLCAIVRQFDRELLLALSGCTAGEIAALLASDDVTPASEVPNAYRLQDPVQSAVIARLRAQHPGDELTLHTRAFEYFLGRLEQTDPDRRHTADEEACLYHLGELRLLLTERREWQTIAQYIASVRAVGPRQERHLHQLSLYDGFVAIRTQNYDLGEKLLNRLLETPDLASDIHMRALNFLAQAQWYQTHYDRALDLYQQVYALANTIDDQMYQGVALLNMSQVYVEIGFYEQALDLSMQSLQIFRRLQLTYLEASALSDVGRNAMQLGRWQVAQEHIAEAIKLCEALGSEARLANLYWSQGFLHHLLGAEAQSETAYLRGLEIAQSPQHGDPSVTMDLVFSLGLLCQTQGRWDAAMSSYEKAIALAQQLRNQHSLTFIHYRRGNLLQRQGHLDAAAAAYREAIEGIEELRSTTETEEIKIGLLGTTQQVYESMVLLCLGQDRVAEAFDYVEQARSRAFLDTLAKKSPELYAAVDQPVATLAEVQSRLPPGALLVEYFTIGVLPTGEHLLNKLPKENARLREHLTLTPGILIFAVTREGVEVHRAALDPNVLRPHPGDPGPGRRLLNERMLTRLDERLIGPIRHLLRGRDLLYLIPHGPLHYVPFLALRTASGEHLLDAQGPAVALAPSATVLLRNCLSRPKRAGAAPLVLGYNDTGQRALRYAEAEAGHVARLLGGTAWVGSAPKSQRLLDEGRSAGRLHIAGHAVYDLHDPLESHLRLGADDQLSARAIIGGLELDADLVALSACTSGLNHVVPGDELLGLQRAFLYAGAAAVVCTLWETFDFVALLVMDRFYGGLRQGRAAAVALRDAQVAVRAMTGRDVTATIERWRAEDPDFVAALGQVPIIPPDQDDVLLYVDPFYWAPFMLIGRPD